MSKIGRWPRALPAVTVATGLAHVTSPAFAHHVMDGALPGNFGEGLLSGLGHPIIGLDHLAFVVAVGLAAAAFGRNFLVPLVFVAATLGGTVIHLNAMDLPAVEMVIALTVVAAGGLLIVGRPMRVAVWLVLFAIAGFFHGYAYGESIVGAEPEPLIAYLIGFAAIQYGIAVTVVLAFNIPNRGRGKKPDLSRIAGGVVAGIGLAFLSGAVVAV